MAAPTPTAQRTATEARLAALRALSEATGLPLVAAGGLAKTVLAFASGGTRYGFQLAMGLIAMASAAWLGLLLSN